MDIGGHFDFSVTDDRGKLRIVALGNAGDEFFLDSSRCHGQRFKRSIAQCEHTANGDAVEGSGRERGATRWLGPASFIRTRWDWDARRWAATRISGHWHRSNRHAAITGRLDSIEGACKEAAPIEDGTVHEEPVFVVVPIVEDVKGLFFAGAGDAHDRTASELPSSRSHLRGRNERRRGGGIVP